LIDCQSGLPKILNDLLVEQDDEAKRCGTARFGLTIGDTRMHGR
jgi:hypothetical protein